MEENKVEACNEVDEQAEVIEDTLASEETLANENSEEEPIKEDEKVEVIEDKAAEYLERLQRLMAEFDNYRKRSEKEKADSYDFAVSSTVLELLPAIDNFERALKVESEDKAFYSGVEMIYKQLLSILEKLKVVPIEAVGMEFNPNLHNAIMHIDDENYGENIIAEELQKGYLYKEKVVRHSLVKVAN